MKNGELDPAALQNMGLAAIHGSSQGFLYGSISAGLAVACKAGRFGAALESVSPEVLGAAAVSVLNNDTEHVFICHWEKEQGGIYGQRRQ